MRGKILNSKKKTLFSLVVGKNIDKNLKRHIFQYFSFDKLLINEPLSDQGISKGLKIFEIFMKPYSSLIFQLFGILLKIQKA